MKKNVLVITLSLIAFGAMAQTNTSTNVVLPVSSTNKVVRAANDLLTILEPIAPYLTNAQADLAGLYYPRGSGKSDSYGGLLDVRVYNLTPDTSVGGGVAYINNEWFVTAISTKLGYEFTVPVINKKGYAFVETGLAIPVNSGSMENQSVAGIVIPWDLGNGKLLTVEGGIVKETTLPGQAWFGGISFKW